MIKIKPIIRKIKEADRLVDVVDIEGKQVAVVMRSFGTVEEAKKHDNIIVDEDFDSKAITDLLSARATATAEATLQAQKDAAQDAVDNELAKAVYGITHLLKKYIPTLTAEENTAIDVFRTKYEKWISK